MKSHTSEIIRIINGGLYGNPNKVRAYAEVLASKLAQDGDADAADAIIRVLARTEEQAVIVPMKDGGR